MAGIGTMTFYDPQSGTFGALGHGVTDVDTGQLLPLDHGSIMDASVKAVKKGERASPGELKGDFDLTRDSGTLYANTECGIFGKLSAEDAAKITGAALPIAKKDEVKTGKAAILATVSGNETREYDIEIEKIYSPSGSTRNLLLRVTDEELLAQTGGVVQGMVVSYNRDNSGEKPLRRKALRACRIGAPVRCRRGQYGTTPFLQTG